MCEMYVAAVRIAHDSPRAIGIQYQQGLKDLVPASDLAEGLLTMPSGAPVFARAGREDSTGGPVVHFNEVDECAAWMADYQPLLECAGT